MLNDDPSSIKPNYTIPMSIGSKRMEKDKCKKNKDDVKIV